MLGIIDVAGGSRASMAMMVAEELGVEFERVRPSVGDTSTMGFNFLTAGSRGTFAGGIACVIAARQIQRTIFLRTKARPVITGRDLCLQLARDIGRAVGTG